MEALTPHRVLMLQGWELHLQSSVGQEPLTNLHPASVCFHSPSWYPTPSLCPARFLYCDLEPCSFLLLEGLGPSSVKDLRIPTAQVIPDDHTVAVIVGPQYLGILLLPSCPGSWEPDLRGWVALSKCRRKEERLLRAKCPARRKSELGCGRTVPGPHASPA